MQHTTIQKSKTNNDPDKDIKFFKSLGNYISKEERDFKDKYGKGIFKTEESKGTN